MPEEIRLSANPLQRSYTLALRRALTLLNSLAHEDNPARVLIVGFGRGLEVPMLLAGSTRRTIVAVDPDEEACSRMTKTVASKAEIQIINDGIDEVLTGKGLEQRSFDLVVAQFVLHLLPDSARTTAELHSMTDPAGRMFCTDWAGDRIPPISALWKVAHPTVLPLNVTNPIHPSTSGILVRVGRA